MRILLYGGSFNPPHVGHTAAVKTAVAALKPDLCIIMPARTPPHKTLPPFSPTAGQRFEMCKAAFGDYFVSDLEITNKVSGYTINTVNALKAQYHGAEVNLLIGGDMLKSIHTWYKAEELLCSCKIVALCRENGEKLESAANTLRVNYNAYIQLLPHTPVEISSSRLRAHIQKEYLPHVVYELIKKNNLYPDLVAYARERLFLNRFLHTLGVAKEARVLAIRYGANVETAVAAALLHDITKEEKNQLKLCKLNDIIPSTLEKTQHKLLHAMTAEKIALALGSGIEIATAVRYHTTGRAGMSTLEKIIYLADWIEPFREQFLNRDKMRAAAYEDLDRAVLIGLTTSIYLQIENGRVIHPATVEARNDLLLKGVTL